MLVSECLQCHAGMLHRGVSADCMKFAVAPLADARSRSQSHPGFVAAAALMGAGTCAPALSNRLAPSQAHARTGIRVPGGAPAPLGGDPLRAIPTVDLPTIALLQRRSPSPHPATIADDTSSESPTGASEMQPALVQQWRQSPRVPAHSALARSDACMQVRSEELEGGPSACAVVPSLVDALIHANALYRAREVQERGSAAVGSYAARLDTVVAGALRSSAAELLEAAAQPAAREAAEPAGAAAHPHDSASDSDRGAGSSAGEGTGGSAAVAASNKPQPRYLRVRIVPASDGADDSGMSACLPLSPASTRPSHTGVPEPGQHEVAPLVPDGGCVLGHAPAPNRASRVPSPGIAALSAASCPLHVRSGPHRAAAPKHTAQALPPLVRRQADAGDSAAAQVHQSSRRHNAPGGRCCLLRRQRASPAHWRAALRSRLCCARPAQHPVSE
jgi:hypothetical protein